MKIIIKGGAHDGEVINLDPIYRYGDPEWVDPESPDFDAKVAGRPPATYQLKPKPGAGE